MSELTLRKATTKDVDAIYKILRGAYQFMIDHGNPTQWDETYPQMIHIEEDLRDNVIIVAEYEGKIVGTMSLCEGPEDYYEHIDGEWLNSEPYVTIHRLASDTSVKGVGSALLAYAEKHIPNIRIDTHADNYPMKNLLTKRGYTFCGSVIPVDELKCIAFQKINDVK